VLHTFWTLKSQDLECCNRLFEKWLPRRQVHGLDLTWPGFIRLMSSYEDKRVKSIWYFNYNLGLLVSSLDAVCLLSPLDIWRHLESRTKCWKHLKPESIWSLRTRPPSSDDIVGFCTYRQPLYFTDPEREPLPHSHSRIEWFVFWNKLEMSKSEWEPQSHCDESGDAVYVICSTIPAVLGFKFIILCANKNWNNKIS
jgi:hypothetical protein